MELLIPEGIAPPASNYSHGVVVPAAGRRLLIAGQIGLDPDGTLAVGLEAQMERCWLNIFAILKAAGMTKRDLVKITAFVTRDGATARYREIRDRMLEGHAPAATYLVVAGLASPEMLVEIEAEAVASV
ncbi:MAG TPA: RidA family protein [Kiloniellales bacterium]|jgi:enamine deaminase RidA (YjgF/YER057c/UK114 family)